MPTYEYKCDQCGKFEYWQNITDDPLAECPTCESPVKRLISRNVNIIFKGPGFYVTDNRASGPGGSNGNATSPKESSSNESSNGDSGNGSTPGKSDSSSGSSDSGSSDSGSSEKKSSVSDNS